MLPGFASVAVGFALAGAAGAKVADPVGSAVGLSTYGLPAVQWLVWVVAAVELVVAGLALSGAAVFAAALLGVFAVAQAGALLLGRGGAPCGCAGSRGRLSWWSAARVAALAVLATAAGEGVGVIGAGVGLAVGFAAGAWLSARSRPAGALDIAGEGPAIGSILDVSKVVPAMREQPRGRLLLFTAPGCSLCSRLRRAKLPLTELAAADHPEVPGAPYAVVVDADGRVLAKGTPNTRRQLANLLTAAEPTPLKAAVEVAPSRSADTRRTFLHRTAAVAGAVAAGGAVKPGDADAFHFCGHIYTTDGCPHPTGLPRIDSKGFPLRAADGRRIDDLGRLIGQEGRPIDEDGNPMLDADGVPLPPMTRTRVCAATADAYGITARVDGAWYRCCGGHVRKLVDCCTTGTRRINGDRALKGYCYGRRKVFCVMYYQTRVPC